MTGGNISEHCSTLGSSADKDGCCDPIGARNTSSTQEARHRNYHGATDRQEARSRHYLGATAPTRGKVPLLRQEARCRHNNSATGPTKGKVPTQQRRHWPDKRQGADTTTAPLTRQEARCRHNNGATAPTRGKVPTLPRPHCPDKRQGADTTTAPLLRQEARCRHYNGATDPTRGKMPTVPWPLPTYSGLRKHSKFPSEERQIYNWRRNERTGKREIPLKTRRPAALFSTIPTCENPGVTPPGIEPGLPSWERRNGVALHLMLKYHSADWLPGVLETGLVSDWRSRALKDSVLAGHQGERHVWL
ncbi:hypothetical protein PR048_003894 [Dryococelus australis]|uniref:Uncharacterized protein n=1 Tax=Dryococelus australis TaxID=614101 RepID=A0ABQ9IPE4_9NEOP|nr:hypothetical protein PR048_003894 [Dryococelus australis]